MRALSSSRWFRRLAALALGLILACAATELALRWLVLSDSALAVRWGARLRRADYYAPNTEDAFWKLACRFDHAQADAAALADPLLGWRNERIDEAHAHADAAHLGERRPILLYGDSFAEGVLPESDSFQGLCERSPLSASHALLNYGVGGFGLDQMLLLSRDTLGRWRAREPVALVAILVDDDLERCRLGFRSGPKPRFRVEQGALLEPEPLQTRVPLYLEQHPIGIQSYLWRLACFAPGVLPAGLQNALRGDTRHLEEQRELAAALVRETCRTLRAGAPRAALLLMHGRGSLVCARGALWQEELVLRIAAEEGLPVLETRPALLAAVGEQAQRIGELYIQRGSGVGHWNRAGNLAVFEVLRAFVEGATPEQALERVRRDRERGLFSDLAPRLLQREVAGAPLEFAWREEGDAVCFAEPRDGAGHATGARIALRAGTLGPSELRWTMPAGARRFRARLHAVAAAGEAAAAPRVVLRASWVGPRGDGQGQSLSFAPGEDAREWTLELGPGILSLNLESPGPGLRTPWLVCEAPVIERD